MVPPPSPTLPRVERSTSPAISSSQQRKRVEHEEDHHGADEQEYEKDGADFPPVYPALFRVGRAVGYSPVRTLHLRGRRGDVEGLGPLRVDRAAAPEVPLVVALADELSTLRAARQRHGRERLEPYTCFRSLIATVSAGPQSPDLSQSKRPEEALRTDLAYSHAMHLPRARARASWSTAQRASPIAWMGSARLMTSRLSWASGPLRRPRVPARLRPDSRDRRHRTCLHAGLEATTTATGRATFRGARNRSLSRSGIVMPRTIVVHHNLVAETGEVRETRLSHHRQLKQP